MKRMHCVCWLALLASGAPQAVLSAAEPYPSREIKGKVLGTTDNVVRVTRHPEFDPNPGDPAEIYFPAPGAAQGVVVATGKVASLGDTFFTIRIDRASGKIARDYYVRVRADKPVPRAAERDPNPPAGVGVLKPLRASQWL